MIQLFAAHGHNDEVGVSGAGLRIDGENSAECSFGGGQVAGLEGGLALREGCLGIDGRGVTCVAWRRLLGRWKRGGV